MNCAWEIAYAMRSLLAPRGALVPNSASMALQYRCYFLLVGLFALWVGLWGYLQPGEIGRALPWNLPPLHARFAAQVDRGDEARVQRRQVPGQCTPDLAGLQITPQPDP